MGKALIIIVLGYSFIFGNLMLNVTTSHRRSSEALVRQYEAWIAHNAAESVTNVAVSKLYRAVDPTDTLTLDGATCIISTQTITPDSITVTQKDSVSVITTFGGERDTTETVYMHPAYSHFYYYTFNWPSSHPGYATGDTVRGPVHSNGKIKVSGSPVFLYKVTSKDPAGYEPSSETPKFYGGTQFDSGELPLPNLTNLFGVADYTFSSELWLEFHADGTCSYTDAGGGSGTITLSGPTVITTSNNRDIHVEGVVNGQITVVSDRDLYIENDIVCNTNPLSNPNSTDLLGLVAERDVIVQYSGTITDITIQAAIAAQAEFKVSNGILDANLMLTVLGSIVANQDEAFADLISNILGFTRTHTYDSRFIDRTPPYFPRVFIVGRRRIEPYYQNH